MCMHPAHRVYSQVQGLGHLSSPDAEEKCETQCLRLALVSYLCFIFILSFGFQPPGTRKHLGTPFLTHSVVIFRVPERLGHPQSHLAREGRQACVLHGNMPPTAVLAIPL